MKKSLISVALVTALGLGATQVNAGWFNNGPWDRNGSNWSNDGYNDWPEWTPMYWAEEFMDEMDNEFNDNYDSGYYGPNRNMMPPMPFYNRPAPGPYYAPAPNAGNAPVPAPPQMLAPPRQMPPQMMAPPRQMPPQMMAPPRQMPPQMMAPPRQMPPMPYYPQAPMPPAK